MKPGLALQIGTTCNKAEPSSEFRFSLPVLAAWILFRRCKSGDAVQPRCGPFVRCAAILKRLIQELRNRATIHSNNEERTLIVKGFRTPSNTRNASMGYGKL